MSRYHYEDVSESSGDEGKLFIDETPKPKRVARRRKAVSEDAAPQSAEALLDGPQRKKSKPISDTDDEQPGPSRSPQGRKKNQDPQLSQVARMGRQLIDKNEQKWQRAMDLAVSILVPLKVDIKDLTLLPDSGTMECLKKAAQAWMNDRKKFIQLTFSTQKSLQTVIARFLLDFILRGADITAADWNPSGCVVWEHKADEDKLYCLHGLPMINKEQIIEMDINSENGQRALKDTPERAKIVTNRWGRSVVQVKNSDAMSCYHDLKSPINSFSSQSCGYFYTDGPKALMAFKQIGAFVKAMYPNMPKAGEMLLMPLVCDCNYGHQPLPLLGKQTCKVTPFAMTALNSIDRALIDDAKVLATLDHPAVLVFQCCNPVFRNTKANPQKNCDFKISSTDVVMGLQLAKQIWNSMVGTKPPIVVQEFKWLPQYRVQNTILPTGQEDADDALF
ncbi:DBP [Bovine mastadenovirus A]|uniref:DBP n=1 Tax=Bovine mastadenovirus A TaxID=129953 RepID=UPI0000443F94|nr:DBP [Bovine mastadenovirus A]